jgi:heptosyltransferase III
MLIQQYTAEIVGLDSNIDQVLIFDRHQKQLPFFELVALLRKEQFDVILHTHARFWLVLASWFAGIPVRIGTGYRWYSFLLNRRLFEHRKNAAYHELEYNIHLLRLLGCKIEGIDLHPVLPIVPDTKAKIQVLLQNLGIQAEDQLVIIHPGSGRSARDWKPEYFGELARKLVLHDHVKVIVTGTSQEQAIVETVTKIGGENVFPVIGKTTLREYCALASAARLFIANSTGPIHIAAAVGSSVIGLYPQVPVLSAARWGPYTEKKTIIFPREKPLDCTLCRRNLRHGCKCMDSISVEEVLDASLQYLKEEKKL